MRSFLLLLFIALSLHACAQNSQDPASTGHQTDPDWKLTETEWKERLTSEEFEILRNKGTEPAFSGKYWNLKADGVYHCAGCGLALFASETKYKSGTGWPSFYAPVNSQNVAELPDNAFGWNRTEVVCARCGGHLGHVFSDGPKPTGLRYCLNSAALDFESAEE